jgi:hypothetical protein
MTLDEFRMLVLSHDLTYDFSDDYRVRRRGDQNLAAIREAAEQFDRADVVRIWNEAVDKKLSSNARSGFYWKE